MTMKRIIVYTMLLCGAMTLSAQTYKDGVWYSLYDEEEHTMNTQGDYKTGAGDVFAPTAGTLTVKWKYSWVDWVGFAKKIDTDVLESADGGSNTREVGSFQENTSNNSNTTETFSVSRNINWIKYNRSGLPTHKVIVYHQSLPLAKHILLPSGDYGTSTASLSFADQDMLTVSDAQRVKLRSFLSNGDITVTCSEPEIFRLGAADNTAGLTYTVGANACASANVGNIDNYAFDVYFAPQADQTYQATITITDGTSTATVTVSGTGLYVTPPTPPTPPEDTYYAYSAVICEGEPYLDELFHDLTLAGEYTDTIPNVAGGDSIITFTLSLNPRYAFEDSLSIYVGDSILWQNLDLSVLPIGDTTLIVSYQAITTCDSTYTLYLSVMEKPLITTYGNDTIELCHGDKAEYEGRIYRRATLDSVLLSQKNVFGGDSIVELVVIVYPEVKIEMSQTLPERVEEEWEGYDLSTFPIGDTILVAAYTSVHGCDSTFVLHLTVVQNTEGFAFPAINQEKTADKIFVNGQLFIRKGEDYFDALGRKL